MAVDAGVTATYNEVTLRENREALDQALAALPVAANPDSKPKDIIAAASHTYLNVDPFTKDGFTWVGRLGFAFSESGQLIEVRKAWQ